MNNYVSAVLKKIRGKNHRQSISKELQAHIDDRTEYYINAGYDEETARLKANDDMGEDAETVGQQLGSIHQDYSFLNFIYAIINAVLLFFFIAIIIFSIETDGDGNPFLMLTRISHLWLLSAFVITMLAELYFALKFKLMFTAICIPVNLLCYSVLTAGYVPVVFAFYKLIKGEFQSYIRFTSFYEVKLENSNISAMSIAFISICIILSLLSLYVVFRFSKLKYGLKTVKLESILKTVILTILLFVSAVFGYTYFAIENAYDLEYDNSTFEGAYVIESNKPVAPESIKDYDKNYLDIHYDWSSEHVHDWDNVFYHEEDEDIECNSSYEIYLEGETDVSCKVDRIYAEFKPTKKYVMVVPVFEVYGEDDNSNKQIDFAKGKWLDTSKEHTVTLDDYEGSGIVFKTKVKILKR